MGARPSAVAARALVAAKRGLRAFRCARGSALHHTAASVTRAAFARCTTARPGFGQRFAGARRGRGTKREESEEPKLAHGLEHSKNDEKSGAARDDGRDEPNHRVNRRALLPMRAGHGARPRAHPPARAG